MNFIKKNPPKILLAIIAFFTPLFMLYAATCKQGTICNPINVTSINDFVLKILQGVVKIGIPIIALAIIYSGFLFVSAQGNDEKLTKAKNALLYSVIGAAILLGSWAIAQLISETVIGVSS